jgi:predicted nucleic acid-binding Zn ribbon protein
MVPLQGLATAVIADAIRRQPASPARTTFAWTVAVGPALSRATSSVELRDRVLYITPKDAHWRKEFERAAPTILARVQVLLGADTVSYLKVRPLS